MTRASRILTLMSAVFLVVAATGVAGAAPLPGGTLDPATVPQYVIPLVIPPVMNNDGAANHYEIAVRQFKQQILPGGIWNTLNGRSDAYPATTVWSYGPASDPLPDSSALGGGIGIAPAPNSQFNYPAYTVETRSHVPVQVRWINELKPNFGAGPGYLPHLLSIDQTLHWANPPQDCMNGDPRTDCMGDDPTPYTGPVPIVTHVHGAHVDPDSDGFPEAWWLPALGEDLPAGYASEGTLFDDAKGQPRGLNLGYADFRYRNDQPATTLWYHDHTLGMTRSNVYAGPAGFWLVRGGQFDRPTVAGPGRLTSKLPSPAPARGEGVLTVNVAERVKYREIPIVIQDRSFNADGSLFYPANRAFFEGLGDGQTPGVPGNTAADLLINFIPDSDIAPIWNPEAFFNVMVVNGVSWPYLEVAPALYRFRFLNGCNSRFLWLKFGNPAVEVYQIGAEQGFLPAPVLMNALNLDQSGDNTAQLIMALAERADVIVDFRGLANGTGIELLNIGPDEPFGGGIPGVAFDPADPATTGRVMKFVVNAALLDPADSTFTDPAQLVLNGEPAIGALTNTTPRLVSLNEEMSGEVYVCANDAEEFAVPIVQVGQLDDPAVVCPADFQNIVPFGPKAAKLGTVTGTGASATGNPLGWEDASDPNNIAKTVNLTNGGQLTVNVTENPDLNAVEQWEMFNFTADAHPIHLHLVRVQVVEREIFLDTSPRYDPTANGGAGNIGQVFPAEPWEAGYKDTETAFPGEITRVKAKFDIPGLYVWHCHIVEHEDNEMMRPYFVGP